MSDRRENSVLFSLRELRSIEEDRVKQEVDAEKDRIEGERKAREDEIRRAKEAEEGRIRAAEDKVRREKEDKERAEREGQLRLQESERRAQIEAATRLEQHRIEAEARAKVDGKKFPTGMVVGIALVALVIAGGIFGSVIHNHNVENAAQKAAAEKQREDDRKAAAAAADADRKRFETEMAEMKAQLDKAGSVEARAAIQKRIDDASASRAHHSSSAAKNDAPKKPAGTKIKGNSNDPLGGLDL